VVEDDEEVDGTVDAGSPGSMRGTSGVEDKAAHDGGGDVDCSFRRASINLLRADKLN
jgi:hypothetical protein